MAYVALTKTAFQDIGNKIERMKHAELQTVPQPPSVVIEPNDPWFLQNYWGENAHLFALVPDDWCGFTANISALISEEGTPRSRAIQVTAAHSGKFKIPPRVSQYKHADAPRDNPHFTLWYEFYAQAWVIEDRWKNVKAQVMEFLGNCKSLNEALKLWPDVRLYVPDSYLAEAARKKESKPKESKALEALKKLNTDELTSAVVAARLTAGVPL